MKIGTLLIRTCFAIAISIFVFALSLSANAAVTKTVVIESFQFQPSAVTIKKGGSITFVNKDAAPHTVSPAKNSNFTGTGRLLKDESKAIEFPSEGTYDYFCDFHPSMKGSIKVTK